MKIILKKFLFCFIFEIRFFVSRTNSKWNIPNLKKIILLMITSTYENVNHTKIIFKIAQDSAFKTSLEKFRKRWLSSPWKKRHHIEVDFSIFSFFVLQLYSLSWKWSTVDSYSFESYKKMLTIATYSEQKEKLRIKKCTKLIMSLCLAG